MGTSLSPVRLLGPAEKAAPGRKTVASRAGQIEYDPAQATARSARRLVESPGYWTPERSADAASRGIKLNRGSSTEVPLTPEGHAQMQAVGKALAAKGGVTEIRASPAVRTQQTAAALSQATGAPVRSEPGLESWAQGPLEGMPKKLVRGELQNLIRKKPYAVVPGQGLATRKPGESAADFSTRVLRAIVPGIVELSKNPSAKIVYVVHSGVVRVIRAWIKRGTPDDFKVGGEWMKEEAEKPGETDRLYPEGKVWKLAPVNLNSPAPLDPGIYLVRHGVTPFTTQKAAQANAKIHGLELLRRHVASGDLDRAMRVGKALSDSGAATDSEISDAIDGGIPEPGDLPKDDPRKMMGYYAVASARKKPSLQPMAQAAGQALSAASSQPNHRAMLRALLQEGSK